MAFYMLQPQDLQGHQPHQEGFQTSNTSSSLHSSQVVLHKALGVESNWNLYKIRSIRKFAIRLIRKGKIYSKNSMKINSKFDRLDSTPTTGWSQIFLMLNSTRVEPILAWSLPLCTICTAKSQIFLLQGATAMELAIHQPNAQIKEALQVVTVQLGKY